MCELKYYCYNGCAHRCEFDVGEDVFCHAIGEDLGKTQIQLLRRLGCATRRPKEKKNETRN